MVHVSQMTREPIILSIERIASAALALDRPSRIRPPGPERLEKLVQDIQLGFSMLAGSTIVVGKCHAICYRFIVGANEAITDGAPFSAANHSVFLFRNMGFAGSHGEFGFDAVGVSEPLLFDVGDAVEFEDNGQRLAALEQEGPTVCLESGEIVQKSDLSGHWKLKLRHR